MHLHPSRYRTRLLLDAVRILFFPVIALIYIQQRTGISFGIFTPLCHLGAIILWGCARNAYYDFAQQRHARRLGAKPIPRVKGKWPGNIDVLLRMKKTFDTDYIMNVYLDLFREYKCTTLNTRILWVDQIITMDVEHTKYVLATGFQHFWRGKRQKERMEDFLGSGIFNRDDEVWKMHRSNARPFFAKERISDFQNFDKHTTSTLNILSSFAVSGTACDAQDLYSRFSLDAASEFLFGNNLDTLSGRLPIAGQAKLGPKGSAIDDDFGSFATAFETAQYQITQRLRRGYFWPLVELFRNRIARPSQAAKRWLDPLVQKALEEKKRIRHHPGTNTSGHKTFLQHLAESTEDVGLIRDELLSILLASRDTTSCTLTFVTYFMSIYPDVAKRMRAEVLEFHGRDGVPTYESLRQLKYMRAVINETLRMFPPVPLNSRESRAGGCHLPPSTQAGSSVATEPLYIPGETTIMIMPLLMQRDPHLWGESADEFDPDRWLDPKRIAKLTANPLAFIPFSAGPRICLGQNFAYNEASFFLVRLLQRFDKFTLAPESQPDGSLPPEHWKTKTGRQAIEKCWPSAALTLYAKGGLWVKFGEALRN